jgi:hypothetical protein
LDAILKVDCMWTEKWYCMLHILEQASLDHHHYTNFSCCNTPVTIIYQDICFWFLCFCIKLVMRYVDVHFIEIEHGKTKKKQSSRLTNKIVKYFRFIEYLLPKACLCPILYYYRYIGWTWETWYLLIVRFWWLAMSCKSKKKYFA